MDRARLTGIVLLCLALFPSAETAIATEHFVSPTGRSNGAGTLTSPWNLETALSHPKKVKPGDTIWLRGGRYPGSFTSKLSGQPDAPITVRQYPNERAIIDLKPPEKGKRPLFIVQGQHTRFWGFEITSSERQRISAFPGSHPSDITSGGINCRGDHISFINMIVHNTATGFGHWADAEGGEIYGCLIFHNGWRGPDRGHGHGIYAQNRSGSKFLGENIIFDQFGYGIHIYGSEDSFLNGFHLEGNVAFNNGSLMGGKSRAPNIHVGGGVGASRILLKHNYTFHSGLTQTSVRLGSKVLSDDIICSDNLFIGATRIENWRRVVLLGNTFVAGGLAVALPDTLDRRGYAWNDNTYFCPPEGRTLLLEQPSDVASQGWEAWQKNAGFDSRSRYLASNPKGVQTFVRTNRYEPGRAHIIVYNWNRLPQVSVHLADLLAPGQSFKVVSAQDFFGPPVLEQTFQSGPITLPMRPSNIPRPVGLENFTPPQTAPAFEVFILLPSS
jgi:hypothetical protein